MSRRLIAVLAAVTALVAHSFCDSRIRVFDSDDCSGTSREFVGPNSGRCTTLLRSGNFTSFSIGHLDNGCAVTIYGEDTTSDICSGAQKVAVPFRNCYNESWAYYSIDGCIESSNDQITSSESVSSATTSASSAISDNSVPTTFNISATTAASRPTDSSNGGPQQDPTNVGAIAGGVVGGVAFRAIVAALGFVYIRRRRRARRDDPPLYQEEFEVVRKELGNETPPQELHHQQVSEMHGSPVQELPSGDERAEVGGAKSPTSVLKR